MNMGDQLHLTTSWTVRRPSIQRFGATYDAGLRIGLCKESPVPSPQEDGALEVHGCYFLYDDEEFWLWDEKKQVWLVLPEQPSYLVIVQGKLAVLDIRTGRPRCNCEPFVVNNFGCACGGV